MRAYYKSYAFEIFPGVYPPGTDSYMLAECAEELPQKRKIRSVLDLGTGCGIQGVVASKFVERVVSCDLNPEAVECAKYNAALNNVADVEIFQSDLFSSVYGKFELIVFNPPYLPVEKREPKDALSRAWDGGKAGREITDKFLTEVSSFLTSRGSVIFVQSSLTDIKKTEKILEQLGFGHEILARRRFFFESIYVVSAAKKG